MTGLLPAVFTLFMRKKSVKENAYNKLCKKSYYTNFSIQLVIYIITTGLNSLQILITSEILIVLFIVFSHTLWVCMLPPFKVKKTNFSISTHLYYTQKLSLSTHFYEFFKKF